MNKNMLDHWADIAPLLDELLTLPEAQRLSFLDGLPPAQRAWRAALEQLLRSDAAAASAGFLQQAASLPGLLSSDHRSWDRAAHATESSSRTPRARCVHRRRG